MTNQTLMASRSLSASISSVTSDPARLDPGRPVEVDGEQQALQRDGLIFFLMSHGIEQLKLSWILRTTLPYFVHDNGRNHEFE
jgi:hypothetical protein